MDGPHPLGSLMRYPLTEPATKVVYPPILGNKGLGSRFAFQLSFFSRLGAFHLRNSSLANRSAAAVKRSVASSLSRGINGWLSSSRFKSEKG